MLNKIKGAFSVLSQFFVKNKKTVIICFAVLLCSFLALSVCKSEVLTRDAEFISSASVTPYAANGYSIAGNKYSPSSSDPQIYIHGIDTSINDVSIKLSSPLPKDTACQLFYATDTVGISEENSIWFYASKGATEIYFTVPELVYDFIRVDIDGEFELEGINLSTASSSIPRIETRINYPLFIALILIISVCIVLYFLYSERVDASVLKIKNSYFSTELDGDFSKRTALKTANVYTLIALLAGFMLVFIMPPLSVADEQAHFLNVLRVSHFDFTPTVHGGSVGTFLTADEASFLIKYNSPQNIHMSFSGLFNSSASSSFKTQFFASDYASLNSFAYLIPGVAVAIARAAFGGIDVYSLLIIARLANLILGIVITRHALKITPAFRNTMFLLAVMPMTLHQCASTSYDALLISASFLLFAYIAKLLLSKKDYRISVKDVIIICLCFCIIFAAKPIYATVVIIFLAVSFKKFGNWKKYVACIGLIGACAAVFYLLPTLLTSHALSAQAVASASSAQTGEEFVLNFANIKRVVSATVKSFKNDWKVQFFGVLGWLKIYLPKAFSELFYVILTLTVITDACQVKGVNIRARILSYLSLLIFSVILIMNAFINWNPSFNISSDSVAYGIQGRYFIPIMIFTVLIFANPLLTKFKYRKQLINVSCGVVSITGIVCAMLTLFSVTAFYWF